MANTNRHGMLGAPMSRAEIIGGFLYVPFYLGGTAWLLGLLFRALGLGFSGSVVEWIWFAVNFIAIVLIFRRWLAASFGGVARDFWAFLQAAVLGFAFYYALNWLASRLFLLLRLADGNPNDTHIRSLAGDSFALTFVCAVLLAPPVEETLFRGLIFSNLHEKSRILAYALSALAFAAAHVWQYTGTVGWGAALLTALQYLPAGIALGWTFEKADTVWAPILVHAFINAVALGLFR